MLQRYRCVFLMKFGGPGPVFAGTSVRVTSVNDVYAPTRKASSIVNPAPFNDASKAPSGFTSSWGRTCMS